MSAARILGIAGSLRRGSYNKMLLRAAVRVLPSGAEIVEWDGMADLPVYNPDLEVAPPVAVSDLRQVVATADGLLLATPEYNASLPGGLKNALDWLSWPFPDNVLRNKPSLVVGASTGLFGAVWAQAELRKVLDTSGARVLEFELPVAMADAAFTSSGELVDPDVADRLASGVEDLLLEIGFPATRAEA